MVPPVTFTLGKGNNFLPAFTDAVATMKKGTVLRVVLSSSNAFGSSGSDIVPPSSPVVFDIEMTDIKSKSAS